MKRKIKSVLRDDETCFVCENPNVIMHHIYYGRTGNRPKAEKYGFVMWLCPAHHNMSNQGVHFNKALDLRLKQMAQAYYEQNIGSREAFIQDFGKSYL